MNWQAQDNKKYRGKIDRIYVSMTEHYEVDYFIDHYLSSRSFNLHDGNRKIIGDWMDLYPGRVPIRRDELTTWLDSKTNPPIRR